MSTIGVSGINMEYDAAQALLDLQSNIREDGSNRPTSVSFHDCKEDMEMTARLFLSCFITSSAIDKASTNRTSESSTSYNMDTNYSKNTTRVVPIDHQYKHIQVKDEVTETVNNKELSYYNNLESNNKRSKLFKSRPTKHLLVPCKKPVQGNRIISANTDKLVRTSFAPKKIRTREIGTQTDTFYQLPKIDMMESTIKNLCEKIRSLEAQIIMSNSQSTIVEDKNNSDDEILENSMELSFDHKVHTNQYDMPKDNHNTLSPFADGRNIQTSSKIPITALRTYNQNCHPNELVPIGEGHASVPSRLLRHINWNSYTSATRKLLTAVFSRRVLATHSLTGKPSPAFPNKPAKKKLDPALVNDIVQTVAEKCCVPENVVRTSITTKCADESKMYRTRQKNVRKRKHKISRENIPPVTSESEDSF